MPLQPFKEYLFPNLNQAEYLVTSEETPSYNCIAWAAGDDSQCWDPTSGRRNYWPDSVPREATLNSFKAVFETLGYRECETADRELDFEKIAIFVDNYGSPSHVARQLSNGNWTSKLGTWEDIEHQYLEALAGTASMYGVVTLVMRRPWQINR